MTAISQLTFYSLTLGAALLVAALYLWGSAMIDREITRLDRAIDNLADPVWIDPGSGVRFVIHRSRDLDLYDWAEHGDFGWEHSA